MTYTNLLAAFVETCVPGVRVCAAWLVDMMAVDVMLFAVSDFSDFRLYPFGGEHHEDYDFSPARSSPSFFFHYRMFYYFIRSFSSVLTRLYR